MADESTNSALIVAGIGGAAGLLGGGVTALSETMTRKQVVATVMGGLGFGSFVPPALMALWNFNPAFAGLVGFLCGLTCVGLVSGVRKIGDTFARKPGSFIPQIRDAMKDETLPSNEKGSGS